MKNHSKAPRRLHMSPRRFPPQSPAHPGRKQDDSARQVSWLPGLCLRPPSQGCCLSGMWTTARRSQLRGQPRSQTAFPYPFREPRAYLNANSGLHSRSMRDRRDFCRGLRKSLANGGLGGGESRGLISGARGMHTASLWKSRVEQFAAFSRCYNGRYRGDGRFAYGDCNDAKAKPAYLQGHRAGPARFLCNAIARDFAAISIFPHLALKVTVYQLKSWTGS
jgi:hypothetical protein